MRIQPVCDSYGETHGNKCAFEIAACQAKQKKKKLTIVKNGICGGKFMAALDGTSGTSADVPGVGLKMVSVSFDAKNLGGESAAKIRKLRRK